MKTSILSLLLTLLLAMAAVSVSADPLVTVSPPGRAAMAPELAVGADGAVYLIWLERTPQGESLAAAGAASSAGHTHLAETDLWFAASTDDGRSFSAPTRVNTTPGAVWGFPVSKPRILVSRDGTLHVFYPGNAVDEGSGKAIVLPMYSRSTDGGQSFAAPRTLGAIPTSDNSALVSGGLANAECFGTMTSDDRGGVYTYWIDTRDMSPEAPLGKIFSAVSLDNGRTFGDDFEVFPADSCPCCQITATTHQGRIYMATRQVGPDGNRDPAIAVSSDRGGSFAPRVRWGGAPWVINGCPLKATALAVDGKHVYAASHNGGADPVGAYLSRSTDGGRSFGPALLLHPGALVSDAPVLAVLRGTVIAAWHAKVGEDRRIFASVSRNRGQTFSPPVEIAVPGGTGSYPVMVPRGKGLQLAWQQGDSVVTRYLTTNDLLPSRDTRQAAR